MLGEGCTLLLTRDTQAVTAAVLHSYVYWLVPGCVLCRQGRSAALKQAGKCQPNVAAPSVKLIVLPGPGITALITGVSTPRRPQLLNWGIV